MQKRTVRKGMIIWACPLPLLRRDQGPGFPLQVLPIRPWRNGCGLSAAIPHAGNRQQLKLLPALIKPGLQQKGWQMLPGIYINYPGKYALNTVC